MHMVRVTAIFFFLAIAAASRPTVGEELSPTFKSLAQPFLDQYCVDCHDADMKKGDVAFDELAGVNADNAQLWKRVWEQVKLKEMPPRKKKNQPGDLERLQLSKWIVGELERAMKDRW